MHWKFPAILFTVVTLAACETEAPPPSNPAPPAAAATTAPAPDINAGKTLAAQCAHCHPADNGAPRGTTPFLAGQHADYLAQALKSYSHGSRAHKPIKAHVLTLSEQEMVDVSAWYASLTAPWPGAAPSEPPVVQPPDPATIAAGQNASRPCSACHGIDGNSVKAGTPSLAGLQPEYLAQALTAYFTGERSDPIMGLFKESLDQQEIKAIAAFFASQTRSKTTVSAIGNAAAGKTKAASCAGCHGADGNSINPTMPSLAGQNAPYLEKALLAYHGGQRRNNMMQSAVKTLQPKDLRDLAAFYATQPPRHSGDSPVATKGGFDPVGDGARLAQICSGCHGDNGNRRTPGTPRLSGLHLDYLAAAIAAYRDGARNHATMKTFVMNLSDEDITRLALYYATREPESAAKPGTPAITTGETIAATCAGCHGEHGNSKTAATPSLAGQDGPYLIAAMRSYAHGTRSHADMQNAVKALKDAEVAQVAAYFSAQTAVKPEVRIPEAPEVVAQKCNRCHGENGLSTDPKIPRIAGQSEHYLADALRAYKSDARTSSVMKAMADGLSELEIKALAGYYARIDTTSNAPRVGM